jgi:hypothetical protein
LADAEVLAAADVPVLLAVLDALPEEHPVTASNPAAAQASSAEPAQARIGFIFANIYRSVSFWEIGHLR